MKRLAKVLGKIMVIVGLPLTVTFFLYPLEKVVVFTGAEYQQSDFTIESNKLFDKTPTFKSLMADFFSVPLQLDWYKVTISNRSTFKDENCLQEKPAITRFEFISGNPHDFGTSFSEARIESVHSVYESKHPIYYLESGESEYFIAPSWGEYSINGGLVWQGDCVLSFPTNPDNLSVGTAMYDYEITVEPHLEAWFLRLLVISIFWFFLLSALLSIYDWAKK